MGRKTFSNLKKDKLHELLKLCTESGPVGTKGDPDQIRSELLEDLLARPLPDESLSSSALSEHLDSICEISGLKASVGVRELLFQPETDIATLHRIRKEGKALLRQAASPEQKDVGTALYYAAIASALVFHQERISKLSEKDIAQVLSDLSRAIWLPSDLARLLAKARKCCLRQE